MNKLLALSITAIFTVLCLQSCSSEEDDLPDGEQPTMPDKDSSIDFDGKTYSTWIKDASYYIGIYDASTKDKIVEIPTTIEGGLNQTADLYHGESKSYAIKGCYILDIQKNDNTVYVLLEYSEYKHGLGITELLMLNNNKITKRIKYTSGIGRPNKLVHWYDKEIVATANCDLSIYASDDYYIYSSDLDLIYKSANMDNYSIFLNNHPIDTYRFVGANDNKIYLMDLRKEFPELWSYEFSDKYARIEQMKVDADGEIIEFNLELIYEDGSKETKSFKLNIEDGSLIG